jgi:hypothetical protein
MDEVIQYVMERRNSNDIFFAVHTLKTARQPNPERPGKMKTFRTHENMKEARAFFFDLDVGEEAGKYASQADALAGLERFLFYVNLPSPIVTSSGYGLHVYWVVSEPIPSTIWRERADKLHWIAKVHGLRADPMRTTDQSSVLRVVNTTNFKDPNDLRKVVVLSGDVGRVRTDTDEFAALLEEYTGDAYQPVGYLAPAEHAGKSPLDWDGRYTPTDELTDTCAYVAEFQASGGSVPEPFWHVMAGLLKFSDEGERYYHEWSSTSYPKYNQAETQDKLNTWPAGPPSCDKISAACAGSHCVACPVKTLGKNPIAIANKMWQQRAAPAPQLLPATQTATGHAIHTLVEPSYPYERKSIGIIRKIKDDDEADPSKRRKYVLVMKYDMFPIQQFDGIEASSGFSRWAVTLPIVGQKIIEVQNTSFDPKRLHEALLNVGVIVSGKLINEVRDFMLSYLETLQRAVAASKQYDYMGWEVTENKNEAPHAFVLHGRKISVHDGTISQCAMARSMGGVKEFMTKAGTLAKQTELLDFYAHANYRAHQFIILASMATPFLKFTGQNGVVLNVSGDAGASKSLALYFAASIYGHPKRYPISGIPGASTRNGREDRSMMLANLPFMIDEITLMTPDDARSMVMGDTQPSVGGKMNQDRSVKRMRSGEKANIMICTANSSLHQIINTSNVAGQAGTVRVFEMIVRKADLVHAKWEADAVLRELMKNHGHIGEALLTELLPHVDLLERRIIREMARLDAVLHAESSERFWVALIAITLVIGRWARKLGFHAYDMQALEDWIINTQMPHLRGRVTMELDRRDPASVVMDYLEHIHGKTLRIEPDARGNISGILQVPNGELQAHFDLTAREVWVQCDPFRKHCEREGHPYATIMRDLTARGIVKNPHIRMTLGKGTQYALGRVYCFIVDLTQKDIAAAVAKPTSSVDDQPDINKIVPFKKRDTNK